MAVCPLPRDDTLNTSFAEYLFFFFINLFIFFYRCPINSAVPHVPPLSEIGGHVPPPALWRRRLWGRRQRARSLAPPPYGCMVVHNLHYYSVRSVSAKNSRKRLGGRGSSKVLEKEREFFFLLFTISPERRTAACTVHDVQPPARLPARRIHSALSTPHQLTFPLQADVKMSLIDSAAAGSLFNKHVGHRHLLRAPSVVRHVFAYGCSCERAPTIYFIGRRRRDISIEAVLLWVEVTLMKHYRFNRLSAITDNSNVSRVS